MKILSILIIILGFSQCASLKLEENPPFKITAATYTKWVGGQPGVKGMNVEITYTSNQNMEFDSLYFRKRITSLEDRNSGNKKMSIAYFKTSDVKNFPFELNDDEAIISYKINDKIKYFKIKSVKKGKPMFFPSAPKG
jgi:hypothetical protein